jgi:glycosyltransferase involved in cell wall biosynthesis
MKISIIIPTYNSLKYIEGTIRSVLNSKLVDIEIIVVDDCSTDGTYGWIRRQYPSILLFKNDIQSGGPNAGRNLGLSKATGEWINFLDHDDKINPMKLFYQLKCAKKYSVDIVSSSCVNISKKGNGLILSSRTGQELFNENETFRSLISWDSSGQKFQLGSLLIKKDICPNFTTPSLEYDFVFSLFKDRRSAAINYIGLIRHVHGNNLSLTIKYKEETYLLYNKLVDSFNLYPEDVKKGKKIISGVLARNYYYHFMSSKCRGTLLKSNFTFKNIWLYITSFNNHLMKFTLNKFNILGK